MPVDVTLHRVETELERGQVLPALQRLRSLVRSHPERLDVRSRLADVYRSQGESAQAGRWSFLAEDADPDELAAFGRAFRSARGRLAALAWSGDVGALGPLAAERLNALREDATRSADQPQRHEEPDRVQRAMNVVGCAVVVALGLLALIGLGALVVHGARVVAGWI
ncbi:DUF6584 family protein [Krasilnikoviella flava]|uniref:Tetratricopeptide repeat-containing protein n=1 Tax=Krasilnikoviella flava TaxID=526729 RepID=A0A1T5KGD0_9MICO|nr:DUF6584 family protein [Krasilnikoviella flava]SKC62774.1 hypothetical protein SAMN04324258_2180 [Krasilnikoviella flava]